MNRKYILSLIICLAILPMVFALPNKIVYKHEPVLLQTGFNGIGIIPNYSTLVKSDFNISLVNDSSSGALNLLGMSFMTPNGKCISLDSLTFWDAQDNSLNYEDAKTNNWINAIEFTKSLETTITEEFAKLCPYEAIWITSFLAVNMTISNVLGSPIGDNIDWVDLRFSNGIDEKNITDAGGAGWIEFNNIVYWGIDEIGDPGLVTLGSGDTLNSSIGYFVFSNQDNIYLLTNNETKKNKIKIKCHGKFIGENKVCKIPKTFAKYVGANKVSRWRGFSSHIIRLIGGLRNTIG